MARPKKTETQKETTRLSTTAITADVAQARKNLIEAAKKYFGSLHLSLTPILLIVLVIAAYFIGKYQTEVEYLRKGTTVTSQQGTTQPQALAATTVPSAAPAAPLPEITDADHIRGNRNAPVKLVEYSDYECPFCKSFHGTLQQAMDAYGNQVAWVYRHFPLSFHVNAQKQAEAGECIAELGGNDAFWKYTDLIFERTTSNGTGFALDKLGPLAAEIGVNQQAFQQCLDSGKYAQKVIDQMNAGQAAGVTGTPGTFVVAKDGSYTNLAGAVAYPQLKQAIDTALNK